MTSTEELERLLAEATPGPLSATRDQSGGYDIWGKDKWGVTCLIGHIEADGDQEDLDAANAALIVAAVNALPELVARVRRLEEALETIAKGKYGKCPIEGHWPPEKPCTLCGDLGFFDDDPQYNPSKDGHCVEGGARVVARAALNQEPGE